MNDQPADQPAVDPEQRVRELEAELKRLQAPSSDDPAAPWNVAAEHAGPEHTRDVAPLPYRGPGAVIHHFPHLTGGVGGPQGYPYVRAAAELLAELGYVGNGVIRGELTHFDNSLMADFHRFQADSGARENVDAYHGHAHPAKDVAANLIGPYTIQALFDAAADKLGVPVEQLVSRVEYDIHRAHTTAA